MQNHPYVKLWIWVNTNMMPKKQTKQRRNKSRFRNKLRPVIKYTIILLKLKMPKSFYQRVTRSNLLLDLKEENCNILI